MNECIRNIHDCSNVEECYNIDGSYHCECIDGYQTNGSHCGGELVVN